MPAGEGSRIRADSVRENGESQRNKLTGEQFSLSLLCTRFHLFKILLLLRRTTTPRRSCDSADENCRIKYITVTIHRASPRTQFSVVHGQKTPRGHSVSLSNSLVQHCGWATAPHGHIPTTTSSGHHTAHHQTSLHLCPTLTRSLSLICSFVEMAWRRRPMRGAWLGRPLNFYDTTTIRTTTTTRPIK